LTALNGEPAVSQYDPDPNVIRENVVVTEPLHTETVVVERESNTGWWIAVFWLLANGGRDEQTGAQLAEARADALAAEAQANQAVLQSQITGAQQSVEIARSDAARAQADALRAAAEARSDMARASQPVIIQAPAPPPAPAPDVATVTTTSPRP